MTVAVAIIALVGLILVFVFGALDSIDGDIGAGLTLVVESFVLFFLFNGSTHEYAVMMIVLVFISLFVYGFGRWVTVH